MPDPVCGFEFDGKCRQRGSHRCHPRVRHVLAFFTELLVHTKARWAGLPFTPSGWQRDRVIAPLFGEVIYAAELGRYVRKYRTLYLCIARKNGKSELLAGITLYLLCADGEIGAEVYGLALDRDQANLVYRVARQMVRHSPQLSERLIVHSSAHRIIDESTGSFYATVAGDAPGALGFNPSGAYIDELLTQPDRELYDAIRTGLGARAQPLLLLATTAENDPTGFAATEREWSERVVADPELDPERLAVIYAADPDADWTDPKTWKQANPALGDFLEHRALVAEVRTALHNPAAERAFRQYRLNQPVNRIGRAIDLTVWDHAPDIRDLDGRPCYAGLDLASTNDLAAYALDFPDDQGGHDVVWKHFAPASRLRDLNRRSAGHADTWVATGQLVVTEGDAIDYGAIIAALNADRARYDIREVAFDRWGATQLSMQLIDDGWPLVAFGQGFASLSGPTKELLRCVSLHTYRHGHNGVLRWEAANAVTRTDSAGNLKFDKSSSMDKIDGLVAGVMALDRACRHVQAEVEPEYVTAGF